MKHISPITVLLPCHSTAFLSQAIESMDRQTLDRDKFRVLLVLDRVEKAKVVKSIRDSKIHLDIIESFKPGIVAALNLGLDNIESKFIARMDEDDIMHPARMEKQLNYLNSHPKCVALGSQMRAIDAQGRLLHHIYYQRKIKRNPRNIMKMTPIAHPAAMIRRSAIDKVGRYRDFLPEDWDLWVRLSEIGRIENLRSQLLYYRIHEAQLSRDKFYDVSKGRLLISLSYFARKEGLRDSPHYMEDTQTWMNATSYRLFQQSEAFKKFVLWKIKFEKYQEYRQKMKIEPSLEILFKILRIFPIGATLNFFSKIITKFFYKRFLKT